MFLTFSSIWLHLGGLAARPKIQGADDSFRETNRVPLFSACSHQFMEPTTVTIFRFSDRSAVHPFVEFLKGDASRTSLPKIFQKSFVFGTAA